MRLTAATAPLELREPLRISRSVMARRDAVWVTVEHDGVRGHGEVVSSVYLGLTAQAAVRTLRGLAPRLAAHRDPEDALARLRAEVSGAPEGAPLLPPGTPPGVTAAVESALLDLAGKRADTPVHRLLGTAAAPAARTARTIGITDPARAEALAYDLVERGFTVLKIKAGAPDVERDLEVVRAVRAGAERAATEHPGSPGAGARPAWAGTVGAGAPGGRGAVVPVPRLLLDPNGAWTAEQAAELLPRYADLGVEAVEQPIAPGTPDMLAALAERSPLPVIADEDAVSYDDALRLAGRVDGVNIKLAKCGGVSAALRIIDALRGSGTDIMLGCLTASSLGIAPAVHLADRARWTDLDGHLLLAADPWDGIGGTDGTVRAAPRPGLGVVRREAARCCILPGGDPPYPHEKTRPRSVPGATSRGESQ